MQAPASALAGRQLTFSGRRRRCHNIGLNPEAGISEQVARLQSDPLVRLQAFAVLRETYLGAVEHQALMNRPGVGRLQEGKRHP